MSSGIASGSDPQPPRAGSANAPVAAAMWLTSPGRRTSCPGFGAGLRRGVNSNGSRTGASNVSSSQRSGVRATAQRVSSPGDERPCAGVLRCHRCHNVLGGCRVGIGARHVVCVRDGQRFGQLPEAGACLRPVGYALSQASRGASVLVGPGTYPESANPGGGANVITPGLSGVTLTSNRAWGLQPPIP